MKQTLAAANRYLEELRAERPAPVWLGGTAQAGEIDGSVMSISGTAVVYDRPVHLGWLTVLLRPGALAEAMVAPTAGGERDILLLHTHNMARPLGRTALNTLTFQDEKEKVTYEATLDTSVTSVAMAAEEVRAGLLNHASIGFWVAEGEFEAVVDSCGDPQCAKAGLEVRMLIAEEVGLYELSLVAQGACIGTSAMVASRWEPPSFVGFQHIEDEVTSVDPMGHYKEIRGQPEEAGSELEPQLVPVSTQRVGKVLRSARKYGITRP